MPLEVRLKKSTIVLQMWLKQVAQQERITDLIWQRAYMEVGSIGKYLVPRQLAHSRNTSQSDEQQAWVQHKAASIIVQMLKRRAYYRSTVELPRAGIGDPG